MNSVMQNVRSPVHALDYLLKPGLREELVAVLEEAIRALRKRQMDRRKMSGEKPVDMQEKRRMQNWKMAMSG